MAIRTRSRRLTLIDCDAGTVNLEFLIWSPLLIGWLLASFSIFDAVMTRSQAEKASQTITDLVSRTADTVGEGYFGELFQLFTLMTPRSGGDQAIRIISVVNEDQDGGPYTVRWERVVSSVEGDGSNFSVAAIAARPLPSRSELPDIAYLDSLVIIETYTEFEPLATLFGLEPFTIEQRLYVRPRYIREIVIDDEVGGV
jgi:Flp pilus assembly protein TadG